MNGTETLFSKTGIEKKHLKNYSLSRAITNLNPQDGLPISLESEISDEIARTLKRPARGFYVPISALELNHVRAPYATDSVSTGGALVATQVDKLNFVDVLRSRSMVMSLGAVLMPDLKGNLDIPRQTTVIEPYWINEQGTIPQAEAEFDQIHFKPKNLAVSSVMTRRMKLQSGFAFEQFVRSELLNAIALGIDKAALVGDGVSQPLGILNQPGINSIVIGANGGELTNEHIIELETQVAAKNADIGRLAYLTNSRVRAFLKKTEKVNGTGQYIWSNYPIPTPGLGILNGYTAGVSNNIPNNLTKGSSSNLSAIIFGNWEDLIIAQFGAIDIAYNPYHRFAFDLISYRAFVELDINLRHPESWAVATDVMA